MSALVAAAADILTTAGALGAVVPDPGPGGMPPGFESFTVVMGWAKWVGLGVAVVGSLFASLYGAKLVELLDGRLDPATLEAARGSVGFTDALAAQVPGVTAAMETAFMDGLSRGSLVIGVMCLVGSAFAWAVLPGDRYDPLAEAELVASDPVTV